MSETSKDKKTWQQVKSENTRQTILDAVIDAFYELGYQNTTTEKIAKRAGVSRGAMLHHFPSRRALIDAAVTHLMDRRLQLFAEEEDQVNQDAEHTLIGAGIDSYWRQLNTPLFIVFHELMVAARTDPELREIMIPAIRTFEQRSAELSRDLFPDLALSSNLQDANILTQYLMEGLATHQTINPSTALVDRTLTYLKSHLYNIFNDVLTQTDRASAKREHSKPLAAVPSAPPGKQ